MKKDFLQHIVALPLFITLVLSMTTSILRISDENGTELGPSIGPYNEGSSLFMSCEIVSGYTPLRVTWWRNSTMLDDTFEVTDVGTVRNDLLIRYLSRNDMKAVFRCEAFKDNITAPVSSSVSVDMNLRLQETNILGGRNYFSAGKQYTIMCRSTGSRPPPIISWWKGHTIPLPQTQEILSADGNEMTSILNFSPVSDDYDKFITCRAQNPAIQGNILEDTWRLKVHYVPILLLVVHNPKQLDNIHEGDYVNMECIIKANPVLLRVGWKSQGKMVYRDHIRNVFTSNQFLAFQSVQEYNSGSYSCVATNDEGDSESNQIILQVKHSPVCQSNLKTTYHAGRLESVEIICEVHAYPANVSFLWKANNFNEYSSDLQLNFTNEQSRSVLTYTPMTERDFGKFYCWAENSVGFQKIPCIFSLDPAGPPDPVSNCSVINLVETSVQIECHPGYDGGLSQTFTCKVFDTVRNEVKHAQTSFQPSFQINDLDPGLSYVFSVWSHNGKGRSEAISVMTATANNMSSTSEDVYDEATTLLTAVIGIIMGLV